MDIGCYFYFFLVKLIKYLYFISSTNKQQMYHGLTSCSEIKSR